MATNEQTIIKIEARLEELKKDYLKEMRLILQRKNSGNPISLDLINDCHQVAISYFNYAENAVGNSGLLGAHNNGKWVIGFAETCYAILETIINHYKFIRSYVPESHNNQLFKPSSFAYANMQRMVEQYIPSKAEVLKSEFIENNLPINGFESPASIDKDWYFYFKEILGITFGFLVVIGVSWFAILTPEPSQSQFFFMRALFSLALAAIGALIPGFLSIKTEKHIIISATGAIAIFVIVWLINPPALI